MSVRIRRLFPERPLNRKDYPGGVLRAPRQARALLSRTVARLLPVASRRVLVVEDNPDSRLSLLLLLEMRGYDVEVAEDGLRGVRKAFD